MPVDAGVLAGAVVVGSASDVRAFDLGIAVEALLAGADGFVVFDAAFGAGAAVAWVAAYAVETSLVGGALRVGYAANGFDGFSRFARAAATADVARRADADHGSYGH